MDALKLLAMNYDSDDDDYGTQWWLCDDLLEMVGKQVVIIQTQYYWENMRIDALSICVGKVGANEHFESLHEELEYFASEAKYFGTTPADVVLNQLEYY